MYIPKTVFYYLAFLAVTISVAFIASKIVPEGDVGKSVLSAVQGILEGNGIIKHDGSKTGPRVGYSSYCEPEKGFVIYENEKMPFTTEEGENVLWTQGDIDCYKKNKLASASPLPSPVATQKSIVDQVSDPIINCGPGEYSKQYVKDKSSNCKNYVDCSIDNKVWSLMLKSECDKKQADAFPPCTVFGETFNLSPEMCNSYKQQEAYISNIGNSTYTPPQHQAIPSIDYEAINQQNINLKSQCLYDVATYCREQMAQINSRKDLGFSSKQNLQVSLLNQCDQAQKSCEDKYLTY